MSSLEKTERHPNEQQPLTNYQFSAEELRVLRECNTESFFQRSLPLGTGLGLGAYFGVKNGFLQPHVKYGSVPKVVVGVIVGYFIGKFSYQQKCSEKIMRLPNSRLGEILRQRQQGLGVMSAITPDQNLGRAFTLAPFGPSQPDVYSDEDLQPRSTSLNLDVESRPTLSGLDDIYRPTLDSPTTLEPDLQLEPAKPGTTYEDLRKRNRDEYIKRQDSPFSRPVPSDAPIVRRPQQVSPEYGGGDKYLDQGPSQHNATKNKYGDSWSN